MERFSDFGSIISWMKQYLSKLFYPFIFWILLVVARYHSAILKALAYIFSFLSSSYLINPRWFEWWRWIHKYAWRNMPNILIFRDLNEFCLHFMTNPFICCHYVCLNIISSGQIWLNFRDGSSLIIIMFINSKTCAKLES